MPSMAKLLCVCVGNGTACAPFGWMSEQEAPLVGVPPEEPPPMASGMSSHWSATQQKVPARDGLYMHMQR